MNTNKIQPFNKEQYYKILCPQWPDFLDKYIQLPIMQRLEGIGLLCGTDWTPLFHNHFYYSRLDHSIAVALIVWNFTHSKKQTLAGLFHDVSTPAFSHVIDFMKGDALKQQATEDLNAKMVSEDGTLIDLLKQEGYYAYEVKDYHKYPVCDNEMPGLSSDRLEYMFPSGAALCAEWNLEEIQKLYAHIAVLQNEEQKDELGFINQDSALEYLKHFLNVSLLLQKNEDKVVMQLMAQTVAQAISDKIIEEDELYTLAEWEVIDRFNEALKQNPSGEFAKMYNTYTHMTQVRHTDVPLENCFCVNLQVKKRWVDPLVKTPQMQKAERLSSINKEAAQCIKDFLEYNDTAWGCVEWIPPAAPEQP